jgi:hypothetical protein
METTVQKPHITIIGKRWFDKQNGITCHSVEVLVDDKSIGKVDCRCGYSTHGTQFVQTAFEVLQKDHPEYSSGQPRDYLDFLKDITDEPGRFTILISDVRKRGDL